MSKESVKFVFKQTISLGTFTANMTRFLKNLHKHGIIGTKPSLIPTILHLRIPMEPLTKDVPTIRLFLKMLRSIQTKHFIRFTTDLLWIMESDNSDIFYARENYSDKFRDAVIDVHVLGMNDLDLTVNTPPKKQSYKVIKDLSRLLKDALPGPQTEDDDTFLDFIEKLKGYEHIDHIVKNVNDDFHIVLIPNLDRSVYYPFPILGMSLQDARRKYLASERSFDFLRTVHEGLVGDRLSSGEVISLLFQNIQDTEEENDRFKTVNLTYSLVELLFSYYYIQLKIDNSVPTRNEIVLFDNFFIEEKCFMEVYATSMISQG